jgi:hypothetical protein
MPIYLQERKLKQNTYSTLNMVLIAHMFGQRAQYEALIFNFKSPG